MDFESICRDEHRRARVRTIANGIDYVDVGKDRSIVTVHFFNGIPQGLAPDHFRLAGGSPHEEIAVRGISPAGESGLPLESPEKAVDLALSRPADVARYTLSLDGVSGID